MGTLQAVASAPVSYDTITTLAYSNTTLSTAGCANSVEDTTNVYRYIAFCCTAIVICIVMDKMFTWQRRGFKYEKVNEDEENTANDEKNGNHRTKNTMYRGQNARRWARTKGGRPDSGAHFVSQNFEILKS